MGALARLPIWATTGVGSLPHDDPAAAAAHVVAAYDLPFCPQLPSLEGNMLVEWLGGDPRRCGWSPARDREQPRAWRALLAELDRRPPAHRLVKLQVTGPATLATALARAGGAPGTRAETLVLAREIATWLAATTSSWVGELRDRDLDAIVVIDEPALHVLGASGIERTWDPLRASAAIWGLHLCGPVPWRIVELAEPDLLSFDLALAGVEPAAVPVLRRLLARGGRIAWGALRVHSRERAAHALRRVRRALAAVGANGSESLLSASCGVGRMALGRELEIATALRETARALAAPRHRTTIGFDPADR